MKEFLRNLIDQLFGIERCPGCNDKLPRDTRLTIWFRISEGYKQGLQLCDKCSKSPERISLEKVKQYAKKCELSQGEMALLEEAVREFKETNRLGRKK